MSDKNYFHGKLQDLLRRYQRGEDMVFSAFMTAEEADEAASLCRSAHLPFFLFGGYDEAERMMLAISDMDPETLRFCYPITLVSIQTYEPDLLSNRDILGALMAAGIRRDCLGDIIARDGVLLFFANEQIVDFLIENVSYIGRCAVVLKRQEGSFSIPSPHFEDHRDTVASLRLDAIVASLIKGSREQACKMIELGYVLVNHRSMGKKTKEISAGDRIIVRGRGKWIVDECDTLTKKGRIVIKTRKYI